MAKSKTRKSYKITTLVLWFVLLASVVATVIFFHRINNSKFGPMPTVEDLANPKSSLASEIFSSDHVLLGKYYSENRTIVNFDNLSPNIVNALLAAEDIRFYNHSGIDGFALLRVVYGITSGDLKGGGSTISQQLAKNLFPRDTTRYKTKFARYKAIAMAKFKEWVIAVKLERNYTKKEIIALYLNTIEFGGQAFGIQAASRTFFNTVPDSLTVEQSALLIGMLNAPTMYSPLPPRHKHDSLRIRRCNRAFHKRNVVISQMHKYDFISKEENDSIQKLPLGVQISVQTHDRGLSTYFREYLRGIISAGKPDLSRYAAWQYENFKEDSTAWETDPLYGWCNKNFKPDGEPYNIYSDGLKIYTTINSKMQQYAEEAVAEHLKTDLQPTFYKKKEGRKKGPFTNNLSMKQISRIITSTVKRSERYRVLKNAGLEWDSIKAIFNTPTQMTIFSWDGEKDTVMSPIDSIRYYKYFLHSGMMSMDPVTGHVKAYVGGIDYKYFKFDHVTGARRQVGSTFKPFLYTLAMMPGEFAPCHKVPNIKVSFKMPDGQEPSIYTPKLSTSKSLKKYEGRMITLKFGLAHSLNQISAWVMKQYSPEAVIEIVRQLGISTPLDPVYSLCVGAAEVRLSEMVGAYTAYANRGIHTRPIFVSRIEDRNGNVITQFSPPRKEVLSEETAYKMINLMEGVVNRGTSYRLRYKYKFKNQIAGKTGTTNNNSDGWFIGMVPDLITGVWVGAEERSIHFDNTRLGQGANMALPIWAIYMKKIYADKSLGILADRTFERPVNIANDELNCESRPAATEEELFENLYDEREESEEENLFGTL